MTCHFEHPSGTKEIYYEIEYNVPPTGMVWDFFVGEWVQTEIWSRHEEPSEQYWERPVKDFDYAKRRAREKTKQVNNEYYTDPELEAFREQEWRRRINGFWFMNNGKPTFITGTHYFYLTWWRIDIGYPNYRESDRSIFCEWSFCEGDKDSYGLIEAARRRSGKTYRSAAVTFDFPSRTIAMDNMAGIQSKSRQDASKVFSKMINSFRSLPDFFIPIYDTSAGSRPKSVLQFLEKSSKKDGYEEIDSVLGATISYESYENLAYDGTKLIRYLRDECGKTELCDIYQGWSIVKPCLTVGTRSIVGKALYTTTIEEGGSIPFKKLWDNSCFLEKDPTTKRTRTGLYRTFSPAYKNDADFTDRYGVCDEEESKEAMLAERAALQSDPKALAEYIRKNPFTIKEAFYSINDKCIFDSLKINTQVDAISYVDESELYVRGNLYWVDGIGSEVHFVENFNGRWKIHAKFLEFAKTRDILNSWERIGDRYKPTSMNIGITGADTFDHSLKNLHDDKQASDAAFYTYWRHDPLNEELSDTFVCEYIFRQPTADMMSEDLLMQCVFFGTPAIIENAKPGAMSYFERNGYKDFLQKVDGKEGISPSNKNKQSGAEVIEDYVNNDIHKVVFPNLLMDWNLFSLEDSTKFDAAMASMWTLLIARRIGKKFQQKPEHLVRQKNMRAASVYKRLL
jgi:hypothetical protein